MNTPHFTFYSFSSKNKTGVHLCKSLMRVKKYPLLLAIVAALFCTGLASCQSGQEPPIENRNAFSSPSESEVPVSAAEDSQAVLDIVDAIFENQTYMRCFVLPATGPISVPMNEYYKEVRELFSQYTWHLQSEAPSQTEDPGGWSLYLNSTAPYYISISSTGNGITVMSSGENSSEPLYYSTEDGPDHLAQSLANIWAGPDIRHAQIRLSESIDGDSALAEAYEKAFRELYLASGAITDYELRDLHILPRNDEHDIYPAFQITYAVKPTDSTAPCWQYEPSGEAGWVAFSLEIHLMAEENTWRCSSYQLVD